MDKEIFQILWNQKVLMHAISLMLLDRDDFSTGRPHKDDPAPVKMSWTALRKALGKTTDMLTEHQLGNGRPEYLEQFEPISHPDRSRSS